MLEDVGPNRIQVIKPMRGLTDLGLADAKNLVKGAQCQLGRLPNAFGPRVGAIMGME